MKGANVVYAAPVMLVVACSCSSSHILSAQVQIRLSQQLEDAQRQVTSLESELATTRTDAQRQHDALSHEMQLLRQENQSLQQQCVALAQQVAAMHTQGGSISPRTAANITSVPPSLPARPSSPVPRSKSPTPVTIHTHARSPISPTLTARAVSSHVRVPSLPSGALLIPGVQRPSVVVPTLRPSIALPTPPGVSSASSPPTSPHHTSMLRISESS